MLKTELFTNFKRIYQLLPNAQKKSFILFILFGFLTSVVQSFGIVSILPFVSAIADFDTLLQNEFIYTVYTMFNFTSQTIFIVFLAIVFIALLLISNIFLMISIYMKLKTVRDLDQILSYKLFSAYLNYDYEKLLNFESNEIAKNVLNETQNFTQRFILSFLEMIIFTLLSISIITLLLIVDPITSIVMIVVFVLFYGFLNSLLRKRLRTIGSHRNKETQKRFKLIDETLNTIKLVKIHHLEDKVLNDFNNQTESINKYNMQNGMMQQSPYYLMDFILVMSLFLIIFIYSIQGLSFVQFVPKLSFFALAAYKLKPFVNKLYHGYVDLVFYQDSSEKLIEIMEDYRTPTLKKKSESFDLNSIELKDINFSYFNTDFNQLKHVNIKLLKNQIVGLTGKTGSGKTTLIHILMGLLKVNDGNILINNEALNDDLLYAYQDKIAYVPQDVSLMDTSIKLNIAYGLKEEEIDLERVKDAAKLACIDEHIESLEYKYETRVGDNGIKLSGGQRQRLGLARAFYRNPNFLILDEATNSLDHLTETKILNQLQHSHPNCMILMITHRIQSLNRCDFIYLLKDGQIIDEGTYDQLAQSNDYFRSILDDKGNTEEGYA